MSCPLPLSQRAAAGKDETVIHDADRSLAAWLRGVLPAGVTITAEPPAPEWAQRPPALPLVDAFLCDIREDGAGLSADTSPVRAPDGGLVGRQPPVRRYRLSFLLTAWAADVVAGYELLGAVMAACAADDVVSPDCLRGTLARAGLPVTLRCAPPDPAVTPQQL
jgi:Pvc16 N-terminal domain